MFKAGDYVVYKRNVCIIKEVKKKYHNDMDYYVLYPVDDNSLKIEIPADNKAGFIRPIISKKEALDLINLIPSIDKILVNEKMIENDYKALMNTGHLEDLVKIIKTTYARNDERKKQGKKAGEKDSAFFDKCEARLYNELSIALKMSYDEVKDFIYKKVDEIANK